MSSCSGSYGSYCCVQWCENNGRTRKKPGTSFFRIPQDSRSTAWVAYSRRADLMEKPAGVLYKSYRICSDHFTAKDFLDPGRTRLIRTAVPTVSSAFADAADVPSVGFAVASHQNTVPEDHLEKSTIDAISEVSPSANIFDSAERPVGNYPVAWKSAVRSSPSTKFRATVRRLQSKLARCQRTIKRLQKKQSKLPPSISKALGIIRPSVTEEVFKLLCTHLRLQQRGKGKRFPIWLKKFALHLNFRGPRAYRFLAPIFSLPTQRTLRRWLCNFRMSPGVIPGIIQSISASTHAWNERDRVCTLMFDEIALKKLIL
ncbi:uncharacterized protein [Dermacentor albipictus]|uniref:uncharacterized protein n=1 Tax=Dermacentor albipictus TaxID=60249 RepID=UPI0038FC19C2